MTLFPTVGVVGCGTMGSGIAQVIAQSGRSVIVVESDDRRLGVGRARIADFLAGGVERGKVTPEARAATLERLNGTTSMNDLASVDLVVEALPENQDLKEQVWRAISEVVSEDTVLATNTSALSVTALASTVSHPRRFAGLHFFNPPQLMALVEIVRALQTEGSVVSRLVDFCHELDKQPVEVRDRPGFLVNRLLIPFLNDVIRAYDDNLASAEDIDVALELGLGHKIGPLRLLDMIGLDVHYHATSVAYEQTFDPAFAPPPLLAQMVHAGHLGSKSDSGFRHPASSPQ